MTSPSALSTRGIRGFCVLLIVLGVLASGVALFLRVRAEQSARAVDAVLDYNEIEALAGERGVPPLYVMLRLRQAGATGVALQEDTLSSLEEEGAVNLIARPNTAFLPDHGWLAEDTVFTVETAGLDINDQVYTALTRVYPKSNLRAEPPFRVLVNGPREAVRQYGLGLSPTKVARIQRAGLHVIPRLKGGAGITVQSLQESLAAVAQTMPTPQAGRPRGTVIFDGDTIPGFRALIPTLAETLQQHGLTYGAVEFAKQKGDAQLGAKLRGHLVRVHSIKAEELANMTEGQAVQRFALAAKDRNIRVLYLHMPKEASDDPLASAMAYVKAVVKTVRADGFTVSPDTMAHPFAPVSLPAPLLALLFAAGGASVLLWLLWVLPAQLPRAQARWSSALIGLGVGGALGAAFVDPSMGRMLFGLLAAVGFPLLGLTWAYRQLDRVTGQPLGRALWTGIGLLVVTTAITLLGGLIIAGMMTDTRFLVKVWQFAGVKLALALPLLLFGALIITDGVARAGETFSAYTARCRARFCSFVQQPVYLWGIGVALVGLVAVALMLARSGNDGGVGVSGSEMALRSSLEQFLIARPRTKEFLIGHPLFLLGIAAAALNRRAIALLLLLGAAIGQVDVLNTYCHAHTPVLLSLLRTFNGLWLGVLFGAVAVGLVIYLNRDKTVRQ